MKLLPAPRDEVCYTLPTTLSGWLRSLLILGRKAVRFMEKYDTGLTVIVLPFLIGAIGLTYYYAGGERAVHLAQTELWFIWLWNLLRTGVRLCS